jgi:hypothetical protein
MPYQQYIDSVRYVYSLYPEAAKLDPDRREQFCTVQCVKWQVRKIFALAHSYCPDNISVKAADLVLHTFVISVTPESGECSEVWLWRDCAFLPQTLSCSCRAFKLMVLAILGHSTMATFTV